MKKIIFFAVMIFISLSAFTNSNYNVNVSGIINKPFVRVIGNPSASAINIQLSNSYSTKYDLSLYSLNGQKITSLSFQLPAGVSNKTMYAPAGISGMYFLVVKTNNEQQSLKIFIK